MAVHLLPETSRSMILPLITSQCRDQSLNSRSAMSTHQFTSAPRCVLLPPLY
ncbi:hypothetical protein PAXRUDRAFT_833982 [Paxillus rubicundulus Ve08.2h10]|uniref:Uncharacterized protein n=1 Tax=Paxillus rubicundulus Ve08.2h10 TaxID=930991 RepID=A0A0D0DMJ1_9AGAM|nr:hypothetical protein PAXRUDRAFT_833982 [Paxillus rubicundulus Ve08.2h10]